MNSSHVSAAEASGGVFQDLEPLEFRVKGFTFGTLGYGASNLSK